MGKSNKNIHKKHKENEPLNNMSLVKSEYLEYSPQKYLNTEVNTESDPNDDLIQKKLL